VLSGKKGKAEISLSRTNSPARNSEDRGGYLASSIFHVWNRRRKSWWEEGAEDKGGKQLFGKIGEREKRKRTKKLVQHEPSMRAAMPPPYPSHCETNKS